MFYLVLVLLLIVGKVSLTTVDNNEGNTRVQLLQGDIVLTEAQQALIETLSNQNNPNGPQHAVTKDISSLWKEGIVPYIMDNGLSSNTVNVIYDAIREYENQTCIRFRKKKENDTDYLKFYNGYGCSSYIGRVGGEQGISIGLGCERKGVVIHEIFHALGRWHEQARPDRNLYIRIYPENIRTGYTRNFERVDPIFATTQGVPYDFDSLMHYDAYAFSINRKPTIIPIDSTIDKTRLGQRNGFSINDLLHVKALYCPGSGGSWSSWSSWSSCSRTCNGGTQYRKRVCIGSTDCPGVNYQERQCNTATCPTPAIWSSWGTWSGCSASCGKGRRSRMRTCLNGTSCIGKSQEFEDCNLKSCPNLPVWSGWSRWSECSHTCQGGYRYRTRRCQNGANINCSGVSREVEQCNDKIVCNKWTECSKSCGTGVQSRIIGPHNRTEQRLCNTQSCHNESCIQGTTHIGCFKLPVGTLQLMDGRHKLLMDSPYNRTEPIRKCGQVAYANNFRYFGVAFGLCFSGSNNTSGYKTAGSSKICKNGTGNYIGSFSIDVYNISDVNLFVTSINYITECGMDYCHVNRTCNLSSGSSNIHLPHLSYLLIIILILYYAIY